MNLVRVNMLFMSVSGGILILAVMLLRRLFHGRLPGRVFPVLWCIVLLRLMIPLSVSSPISSNLLPAWQTGRFAQTGAEGSADRLRTSFIWEVFGAGSRQGGGNPEKESLLVGEAACRPAVRNAFKTGLAVGDCLYRPQKEESKDAFGNAGAFSHLGTLWNAGISSNRESIGNAAYFDAGSAFASGKALSDAQRTVKALRRVGAVGTVVCAAVFLAMYLSCMRLFGTSVPVEDPFAKQWEQKNRLRRKFAVRQSDRICSPMTYGIIRPVILLPKSLEGEDAKKLAYILQHEMVHIRRMDGGLKLVMAAATCLHWFNPLVWVMYMLLNRDVELACDEEVLRIYGAGARKGYALTLIGMEERKFASVSLLNGFGKNAVEERVGAIMRYKRKKGILAGTAAVLVFTAVFLFAASVSAVEGNQDAGQGTSPAADAVKPAEEPGADTTIMDPPGYQTESLPQTNGKTEGGLQSGQGDTEASQAPGDTAQEYHLIYMLEGMEEKEPARLVYGNGYCLLVPKEDWKMSAPEKWVSEINDSVTFQVVHFSEEGSEYSGQSRDQIAEALTAQGYQSQYQEYQLYKEEGDITRVVEIRSNGSDIWGLCYTYPCEAEEGFGVSLRAMAQHFGLLPLGWEDNLANQLGTEEKNVLKETVLQILEVCLSHNQELLSPYLSASFDRGDLDVLEVLTEYTPEGLSLQLYRSPDTVVASVLVKTTESGDSADYLTMKLEKEDGEWKIASLGLEK